MRTKPITLGTGEEIMLGSLTLQHVDEYKQAIQQGRLDDAVLSACRNSLNRASGEQRWNEASFRSKFDIPDVDEMFIEVLEVSKLHPVGEPKANG